MTEEKNQMILIKLIEIAQKFSDWNFKVTEQEDLILTHKFLEGAKIYFYQSPARHSIYCEISYIYKTRNLTDFMSPSELEEWARKQVTADISQDTNTIAKQFQAQGIAPYLEKFKTWAEKVEFSLEKEKV